MSAVSLLGSFDKLSRRTAFLSLGLLTAINLFNYLDRYVLAAVLPLVKSDLSASDAQLGMLQSAFILSYAAISPFTGRLGDRGWRRTLISGGVLLWSLATVASGLSQSYGQLLAARAFIGLGEAGYAAVAPAIISELFDLSVRGRMLSFFYAALPVGSALGYILGGQVGAHFGWRSAFFLAGAPGLVLASMGFLLPRAKATSGKRGPGFAQTVRVLASRKSYLYNCLGQTAYTFAMGGLAYWMPTYFFRVRGMAVDQVGQIFGGLLVAAGLMGTLLGGHLGDWRLRRDPAAHFTVSAWTLVIAVPLSVAAILVPGTAASFALLFGAEVALFANTGPLNAAMVSAVPLEVRVSSVAWNIVLIHLLGDAISPSLIGWLSDRRGLTSAVLANSVMFGVAAVILFSGRKALVRDLALEC